MDALRATVTREAIVLSLLRGGKVSRETTPARTVPTGPLVGGVKFEVMVFNTVVDLIGALPRVRTGALRLTGVLGGTLAATRVVNVHLPPAQLGVVLAGAVRAGTEVVSRSGAREPILVSKRDTGGVTRPRIPMLMPVFRGGRVIVDTFCAPLLRFTVTREAIVLSLSRGGKASSGLS